jgi:hypothetical protein
MMLHLTHCQCSACLAARLADDAPLGSLPVLDWLAASSAVASFRVTQVIIEKVVFFFFFFFFSLCYLNTDSATCRAGKAWRKLAGRHAKLAVRRTEKIWMERCVNPGTSSLLNLPNECRKSSLLL